MRARRGEGGDAAVKWPRGWSNALGRWRKVLEAKLCRRLPEAGKGKDTDSPLQPQQEQLTVEF